MSRTIGLTVAPHMGYCVLGVAGEPIEIGDWWHTAPPDLSSMTPEQRAEWKAEKARGSPKQIRSVQRARDAVSELIRKHAAHGSVRVAVRRSGDTRQMSVATRESLTELSVDNVRFSSWIEAMTLVTVADLVPWSMIGIVPANELTKFMAPVRQATKRDDPDGSAYLQRPSTFADDTVIANEAQGKAAWAAYFLHHQVTR